MSTQTHALPRSGSRSPIRAGFAIIQNALNGPGHFMVIASRNIRERRAIRELLALDDHLLRDIGISRSDIEHVVQFGRLEGDRA